MRLRGAHEIASSGPRTVPVRSSVAGGKAQECSRPPRPSDVLRAGTARAPVGVRMRPTFFVSKLRTISNILSTRASASVANRAGR